MDYVKLINHFVGYCYAYRNYHHGYVTQLKRDIRCLYDAP